MEQRLLQDEIQDREGKRLCRWFESRLDAKTVVRRFYGGNQLEFCTPPLDRNLRSLNIPNIRKMCIEACLEAMVEERRCTYTDIFVRK